MYMYSYLYSKMDGFKYVLGPISSYFGCKLPFYLQNKKRFVSLPVLKNLENRVYREINVVSTPN